MVGRTVSTYEILESLGEGGMGVVYKARDTRLERFVALKFLKPEGITPERKLRFLQEARSLSGLNHPNIVHVHDIGEWEGMDFIAMEFVAGTTLQELLTRGPLALREALKFAIQIADAVSAAHEAGIVHRDLKPGNIIVTERKRIKVLDFGLAKLVDPEIATSDASGSSETKIAAQKLNYTVDGMLVGSISYMSPEQALGQRVDARSDIFAFGSILYEMLAGAAAFPGSKVETLANIIYTEPKSLSEISTEINPELEWIVARCLRKDPARRFQSIAEARSALEDLHSESSSSITRRPGSSSGELALPLIAPASAQRRSWRWLVAAAGALLIVTGAGIWLWMSRHRSAPSPPLLSGPIRLTTESGLNISPAVSADGKFVAYASDRGGNGHLDIWLRQIGGADAIRLTNDPEDDDTPTFSPDGTQIAFHSEKEGGGLYLVPTLGGPERRLADGGKGPQFSPDGSQIAYWVGPLVPYPLSSGHPAIFVVSLATGIVRRIAPDFAGALHPVWSPDGKHLLFAGQRVSGQDSTYAWWMTSLDNHSDKQGARTCGKMFSYDFAAEPRQWTGNKVLFTEDSDDPSYIGEVQVDPATCQPTGAPRRLRSGTTSEDSPSLAQNGSLVFSSVNDRTNIYSIPLVEKNSRKEEPRALVRDESDDDAGSLSGDGKLLAFSSSRTGNDEIWIRDLTTAADRELTFGGVRPRITPLISPDGKQVAWRENNTSSAVVRITPVRGGASIQPCTHCSKPEVWLPDSRRLLYELGAFPRSSIGLMNVSTGENSTFMSVGQRGVSANSITQDGKWFLFTVYENGQNFSTYAAPLTGAQAPARSSWVQILRSSEGDGNAIWADDGSLLVFSSSRDGFNCLWGLRVNQLTKRREGEPFPIRHFHAPSLQLDAPSPLQPVVLEANTVIVSLHERAGSVWEIPGTN